MAGFGYKLGGGCVPPEQAHGARGRKWLRCGPQQREETGSHFLPGRGDWCCRRCGAGQETWGRAGDMGQGRSGAAWR